nr:integrase, catalytic region, zinc finger, CCHC-type, peptidase aspartic, catalytic [Tanacetum cinerariifolium]
HISAMYDDYIGGQPSAALRIVSAAQAHPDVDGLNSQQQHAQQQGNQAPIQPETVAENIPNAMFDANSFVNPFANPSTSATESSSSQYVDPSNMHTFYQPYPREFQWTKDHPLEQVIGEPSRPELTRNQLRSDGYMCMYALTVITMEPKNVKEAMTDPEWIESMQEELLQFKRLDVWVLVPAPNNITVFWVEHLVSLSLPSDLPHHCLTQGYTHIHFGAIRLALTFHGRKGLPAYSRIALLDTRYEKGDPTVGLLGEPSGKFDYYVLYRKAEPSQPPLPSQPPSPHKPSPTVTSPPPLKLSLYNQKALSILHQDSPTKDKEVILSPVFPITKDPSCSYSKEYEQEFPAITAFEHLDSRTKHDWKIKNPTTISPTGHANKISPAEATVNKVKTLLLKTKFL